MKEARRKMHFGIQRIKMKNTRQKTQDEKHKMKNRRRKMHDTKCNTKDARRLLTMIDENRSKRKTNDERRMKKDE